MDYAALAKVLHEIMPDSVSEVERYLTCFSCFRYLKNIIERDEQNRRKELLANRQMGIERAWGVSRAQKP